MSNLSVRLKELRGSTSQAEMAKGIGIPQQAWARYEKGIVAPNAETLYNICRVHACSADWLLGLTDGRDSTTMMKPPTPTVNLEELRTTATRLAEESTALSVTIKQLKKML